MQSFATLLAAQRAALLSAAPRITETVAQTLLALVTLRVQREGVAGARYASRLVPTFRFAERALNAAGRTYVKKNPLGSWAGFRAAQGLPIATVNLTYTGGMFRSLTTVPAGVSGAVYGAKVVAADRESADKVKANQQRYGDFLQATPGERSQGAAYVQSETARVLRGASL